MVIVDFEGNKVEGELRPSSDTRTHAVLYQSLGKNRIASCIPIPLMQRPGPRRSAIFRFTVLRMQIIIPVLFPVLRRWTDEMIRGEYEYQTGFQIINHLKEKNLNYEEVEMILVGNHAPFTWGKNAAKAVYNSAVLELSADGLADRTNKS